MRRLARFLWLVVAVSVLSLTIADLALCAEATNNFRTTVCLNGHWDFKPVSSLGTTPPVGGWATQPILVPSTWNNFDTHHSGDWEAYRYWDYPASWGQYRSAWYHRTFTVPQSMQGQRIHLRFEAVQFIAHVYVNGVKVGEHYDGFTPFEIDITDAVGANPGPHDLAVGVTECPKTSGLYLYPSGSWWGWSRLGIWQDVYLVSYPPVYLKDVFITTSVRQHEITLEITAANTTGQNQLVGLLNAADDNQGSQKVFTERSMSIDPGQTKTLTFTESWPDPLFWWPDDPHLYYLYTALKVGEQTVDEYATRFGFREFWHEGIDYYLNETKIHLRGDSWHFMGACQEIPEYITLWYEMAKAHNVNFIRLTVQPYPTAYLDLADEMGMMLYSESAIYGSGGNLALTDNSFWTHCQEHAGNWVRRERNHPSVIVWSANNEITWKGGEASYPRLLSVADVIRGLDPTRPIVHNGDNDLGGAAEILSGHYGSWEDVWTYLWHRDKPFSMDEFGQMYYGGPDEISWLGGDRPYSDFEARLEAVAEETRYITETYRYNRCAAITPWDLVWYGLEPLPTDRIELYYPDLTAPGSKPQYIGSWSLTLNPGLDPQLPQWVDTPVGTMITEVFQPINVYVRQRDQRFFAGADFERTLVVFNDTLVPHEWDLQWETRLGAEVLASGLIENIQLGPAEQDEFVVIIPVPDVDDDEDFVLRLRLLDGVNTEFERDIEYRAMVRRSEPLAQEDVQIALFDPQNKTPPIMQELDLSYTLFSDLSTLSPEDMDILVVGPDGVDSVPPQSPGSVAVQQFVAAGKTVVYMPQTKSAPWLSSPLVFRTGRWRVGFVRSPGHPTVANLEDGDLRFWGPDETITERAITKPSVGTFRVLIDAGENAGLNLALMLEVLEGKGRHLFCQIDLPELFDSIPPVHHLTRRLFDYALNLAKWPPPSSLETPCLGLVGTGLATKLQQLGLNFQQIGPGADLSAYPAIVIDARTEPPLGSGLGQAIAQYVDQGGRVFIWEPKAGALAGLQSYLDLVIGLDSCQGEYQLKRIRNHPILWGLSDADTTWIGQDIGRTEIVQAGLLFPNDPYAESLLETTSTRWSSWFYDYSAEQIKCAAMFRSIRGEFEPRVGLAVVPRGRGLYVVSAMRLTETSPDPAKASRLAAGLLTGLSYTARLWDVFIDLGTTDNQQGIRRVVVDGGHTVPVTIGGRETRKNQDPNQDFYFFFDVDNVFAYQGNKSELYVLIDYFDSGSGLLALQYDATDGQIYKVGGSVGLTGTDTWKQHFFHLTDACFADRQSGGADFRIEGGVGNTFYLDIVAVSERSPLPGQAANPNPADQATEVSPTTNLSWAAAAGANSYNVYLGKTDPPVFQSNRTQTTFDPASLEPVTTYYWRIDSVNGFGTSIGHLWSFTTGTYPGDFDRDFDVDLEDFGHFQACYSGSGVPYAAGCQDADLDKDSDIDSTDFASFKACLSGANRTPDC